MSSGRVPANGHRRIVLLTDLDGTLLDERTFDWSPAASVLDRLRDLAIPVIPVTSRTRAEVDGLRRETGIAGPAIVESGSAIVDAPVTATADWSGSAAETIVMGCTSDQARSALELLQQRLGVRLLSLSTMSVRDAEAVTGLTGDAARLAARREFGEVIVPPPGFAFDDAAAEAEALGFGLVPGDRFWHLVGRDTSKGNAARVLLDRLYALSQDLFIVALGNGPSDADVLAAADLAIVVPGEDGPHPALVRPQWRVAPSPGPEGWAAAMTDVLAEPIPADPDP